MELKPSQPLYVDHPLCFRSKVHIKFKDECFFTLGANLDFWLKIFFHTVVVKLRDLCQS